MVIDQPGTYQISLTTVTPDLASINLGTGSGAQTLVIGSGGALKFTGSGIVTNGGALHLAPGGSLDGAGTLTIYSRFDWLGGGMAGAGKTLFATGSTITVANGDNKTLDKRTIENASTVNWTSAHVLSVGGGCIWNNLPGSSLDFQVDSSVQFWFGAGGVFNNHGTLRKSNGVGTTSFAFSLQNSGTVKAEKGTLAFTANSTAGGNYVAETGATLLFNQGTHANTSTTSFSGAGKIIIGSGGTYQLTQSQIIAMSLELAPGGLISGPANLGITGSFVWSGGGMEGTGKTVFAGGSSILIKDGDNKTIRERTIDNASNVQWDSAHVLSVGGGTVWNNLPGSVLEFKKDSSIQFWFGTGGTFNNQGTLWKSGGAGNMTFAYNLQNTGTVRTDSGTLYFTGSGSLGANWFANTGATLLFATGTYSNTVNTAFAGPGNFQLTSGGILQIAQPQSIATSFELAPGGLISGAANLTFTGKFTWSGGGMEGTGKTIFANTSLPVIKTGDNKTLRERTIDNAANVSWTSVHVLSIGGGTVWNNLPGSTLDFTVDSSVQFWFGTGGTFNNQGVLKKSGGAGNTTFAYALQNNGTVQANVGTFYLTGGGTLSSTWLAQANASFIFGTGTYSNAPNSNFTGTGTYFIGSGGIFKVVTPQTISTLVELSPGGLISGDSDVTFTGGFTWSGGGMEGTGKTTFANTSSVVISTGDNKTIRERTLNNATTVTWTSVHVLSIGGGTVWNNLPGSTLDFTVDSSVQFWFGPAGVFNNQGTLKKSGGTGNTTFAYSIANSGLIQSDVGTLYFTGGGSLSANWQAKANSSILFGTGTYTSTVGASLTGPGEYVIGPGGVFRIVSPLSIPATTELAPGGLISGESELTFTSRFTWSGGGMEGTGKTTFAAPCLVVFQNGDNKTLRERTINNAGSVTWNSAHVLSIGGGTVWNNLPGSSFDVQSDFGIQFWFAPGGTFNNQGSLVKSAGAGSSSFAYVLNNSGDVQLKSGRVAFQQGFTQTAGKFALAGGHADGPAHFLINGGSLEGAGDVNSLVGLTSTGLPGNPLGRLNIGGDFTNSSSTKLTFQLGGRDGGTNYDQIRATGALKVAGDLIISLANGFEPNGGDSFVLLNGASRTGTFASTNAPDGFSPEVTYTSTNVTLRLIRSAITAPTITQEPQNLAVLNGQPATFTVVASGSGLKYQWRRNGVNIDGASADSYTINATQFTDAAEYSVVVANGGGSKTSVGATLTVNPVNIDAGLIARYPLDGSLQDVIGAHHGATNGTLSYVTNGARDLALRFNGSSWVSLGANPALPFTQNTDLLSVSFWIRPRSAVPMLPVRLNTPDGEFTVYISSGINGDFPTHFGFRGGNWVGTSDLRATINTNLGCWTQFTIAYRGGPKTSPASYAAFVNGQPLELNQTIPGGPIAGANELGRNVNGVNGYLVGDLDEVRVYSRALRPEDALALAANPPDCPPEILQEPVASTVLLGAPFSFSATVIGGQPLRYQWFRRGTAIPDATNSLYSKPISILDDAGAYQLIVTNRFGKVQSQSVQLNITLPQPPSLGSVNVGIPNFISGASFLNAYSGFISFRGIPGVSGGGVCVTANGGLTWSVSNIGVTNDINSVQLVGAVAYIAGNNGLLCISTNNGASWQPFNTGTTETFYGVNFATPTSGWAVGSGGTICYYNGFSWTPTPTGISADCYAIAYGGDIPWAAGASGTICRYVGGVWTAVPTGTSASFYCIAFSGANRGLAVGSGGTICRWNGAAWLPVNSGTTTTIRNVVWADDNTAYIAGDNGLLCISRDGGLTWEPLGTGGSTSFGGLAISGGRAFLFGGGGGGLTFGVPVQVPNLPPTIQINTPTNTQQFYACTRIPVTATASDPDGTVAKVEFFRGQYKLAEFTRPPRGGRPFATSFHTDAFGFYELRAVATDNLGAVTVSDPVTIEVIPPPEDVIIPEGYTEDGMALCFLGDEGAQYVLQGTLDLEAPIQWVNLSTNTMPKLLLRVVDADAVNHLYRHYRFQRKP